MADLFPPAVARLVADATGYVEGMAKAKGATSEWELSLARADQASRKAGLSAEQAAARAAAAQQRAAAAASDLAKAQSDAAVAAERLAKGEISEAEAADAAAQAAKAQAAATAAASRESLASQRAVLAQRDAQLALASQAEKTATAQEAAAGKSSAAIGKVGKTSALLAVGFAAVSVKMAGDFQQQTNVLVTAAGEQQKNLANIRDGILKIATTTGTAWQQVTQSVYDAEKAGFRNNDALKISTAAAEAAREENANLSTVTDGLTRALVAYNLKGEDAVRVTNALKTGAGQAHATFEEYSSGLGSFLSRAANAKISLPDALGVYSSLTQQESAQQAGQNLGSVIGRLANLQGPQIKIFGQLGLNVTDFQNKLGDGPGGRGLIGSLNLLSQTALNYIGGPAKGLLNTFNQSQLAAQDADTMFQALPPAAQKLAQGFMDGSESATAFRKDSRALGGEMSTLAQQWYTTYGQAHGFQDALKQGGPVAQNYLGLMKKLTGGQEGLTVALAASGTAAGATDARFQAINKSYNDNAKEVEGWASTQKLFNVQLDQFKQQAEKVGIELGTQLLPPLKAMFGFFAEHPGVIEAAAIGIGAFGAAWAAVKIGSLITDFGTLAGRILGVGAASATAAGEIEAANLGGALGGGAAGGAAGGSRVGGLVAGVGRGLLIAGGISALGNAVTPDANKGYNDPKAPGYNTDYGALQRFLHGPANTYTLGLSGLGGNLGAALANGLGLDPGGQKFMAKYHDPAVPNANIDPLQVQGQAGRNAEDVPGGGANYAPGFNQKGRYDIPGQAANYAPGFEPGGANYVGPKTAPVLPTVIPGLSAAGQSSVDQFLKGVQAGGPKVAAAVNQAIVGNYLKAVHDSDGKAAAEADKVSLAMEKGFDSGRVKGKAALADLSSANQDYVNAMRAAQAQLNTNDHAINGNSAVAFSNRAAIAEEIQVVKAHSDAVLKQTGDVKQSSAAMDQGIAAIASNAAALGYNKDQVVDYISKVTGIPPQKVTQILADDAQAQQAVSNFLQSLNNIPNPYRVDIEGIISTPGLTASQQQQAIGNYAAAVAAGALAGGGPVVGPGSGTSDTAGLFALSNGEHVWTAAEVKAAGGHAAMQTMRASALNGIKGYAAGGAVGLPPGLNWAEIAYLRSVNTSARGHLTGPELKYLRAINGLMQLGPAQADFLQHLSVLSRNTTAENTRAAYINTMAPKATKANVAGIEAAAQHAASLALIAKGYLESQTPHLQAMELVGSPAQQKQAKAALNALKSYSSHLTEDARQESVQAKAVRARFSGPEANALNWGAAGRDYSYLAVGASGGAAAGAAGHVTVPIVLQMDSRVLYQATQKAALATARRNGGNNGFTPSR